MKRRFFFQNTIAHPGRILSELYLVPLHCSNNEVSKRMKIPRSTISSFIKGESNLSPMMALKVAKAFKTTPHFWLNLQDAYNLNQAMKEFSTIENEIEELV